MWSGFYQLHEEVIFLARAHELHAIRDIKRHKFLGVTVTILSSAVGTSIFATIARENPSVWVQAVTGAVSILATVGAAISTFLNLGEAAAKHKEASADYHALAQRIDMFKANLDVNLHMTPAEQQKMHDEARAIVAEFDVIKRSAPVLEMMSLKALNRFQLLPAPNQSAGIDATSSPTKLG